MIAINEVLADNLFFYKKIEYGNNICKKKKLKTLHKIILSKKLCKEKL